MFAARGQVRYDDPLTRYLQVGSQCEAANARLLANVESIMVTTPHASKAGANVLTRVCRPTPIVRFKHMSQLPLITQLMYRLAQTTFSTLVLLPKGGQDHWPMLCEPAELFPYAMRFACFHLLSFAHQFLSHQRPFLTQGQSLQM